MYMDHISTCTSPTWKMSFITTIQIHNKQYIYYQFFIILCFCQLRVIRGHDLSKEHEIDIEECE